MEDSAYLQIYVEHAIIYADFDGMMRKCWFSLKVVGIVLQYFSKTQSWLRPSLSRCLYAVSNEKSVLESCLKLQKFTKQIQRKDEKGAIL